MKTNFISDSLRNKGTKTDKEYYLGGRIYYHIFIPFHILQIICFINFQQEEKNQIFPASQPPTLQKLNFVIYKEQNKYKKV